MTPGYHHERLCLWPLGAAPCTRRVVPTPGGDVYGEIRTDYASLEITTGGTYPAGVEDAVAFAVPMNVHEVRAKVCEGRVEATRIARAERTGDPPVCHSLGLGRP